MSQSATARPLLRVEYGNAFGVATGRPRLSWCVTGARHPWEQSGYEIAVDAGEGWQLEGCEGSGSVLEPWPFEPLASRQQAVVKVRVTAVDGTTTDWSEPVPVEAALLDPRDWVAKAISVDGPEDLEGAEPPPLLRREFEVAEGLQRARLYITSHGLYTASLGGARVGDDHFAPGWSSYNKRLRYQAYDVTSLLVPGTNAFGIALADGWYRGYLMPTITRRNWYGTRLAAIAQLELSYTDGRREVVGTDQHWRAGHGPLRSADIYRGESYDARLQIEGWDRPGFEDSGWSEVVVVDRDPATLVRQVSPPVRRTETRTPVNVMTSPSGKTIVDFGQNLVGRARLSGISAEPGTEVVLRHAEILQDGELCTEPLRAATATDSYVVGQAPADWAPEFTFHGFRYAEVTGVPAEDVTAEVLHSDMRRTGWFSCSDPQVNQLHDNAVWSMRGNFLDIPTDCPQRDERLGWTGDIQVFAPSACYLYDAHAFLDSWLADLAADQDPSGGVPYVVPNPIGHLYNGGSAAAWSDASVIVPWVVYERYGDRDLLARQYPSMTAFVDDLVRQHGPDLNEEIYQFGDWVDPRAPMDAPGDGPTDKLLVAAAYLVRTLDIMAATASVLLRTADQNRYADAAAHYRKTWRHRFAATDGRLTSDTVTAYALAVCLQLLDGPAEYDAAGARMAGLCAEAGYRVSTGFVGTPLVCDALTATGQLETAYRLLLEKAPPSWLYPVTQGATTIWERWDSLMPDGRVNPSEMTSFNHYALGAVVDWLHRCVGGLSPLQPGYRTVLVRPLPGAGLTSAETRYLSAHGETSVSWRLDGTTFSCDVVVPAGATAEVVLPIAGWEPRRVGSGSHALAGAFELVAPRGGLRPGAPWYVDRSG